MDKKLAELASTLYKAQELIVYLHDNEELLEEVKLNGWQNKVIQGVMNMDFTDISPTLLDISAIIKSFFKEIEQEQNSIR